MNDAIVTIRKETHYIWPHMFDGGNSVRCGDCRYFRRSTLILHGEPVELEEGTCTSKAHTRDRGQVAPWFATKSGNCKWWFPIGKVEGEQEELL